MYTVKFREALEPLRPVWDRVIWPAGHGAPVRSGELWKGSKSLIFSTACLPVLSSLQAIDIVRLKKVRIMRTFFTLGMYIYRHPGYKES
jgi:hypothetical protein